MIIIIEPLTFRQVTSGSWQFLARANDDIDMAVFRFAASFGTAYDIMFAV